MKATDYPGDLNGFLSNYTYQSELTKTLDNIAETPFTQSIINDIVLWKVNRYVRLNSGILELVESLVLLNNGEHRSAQPVLEHLLASEVRGVDLPMASTILRFRNPNTFQIIDRHAYRAVYDRKYGLHRSSPIHKKVSVYFDYLDELIEICRTRNLRFEMIDRALYQFDKDSNGPLSR